MQPIIQDLGIPRPKPNDPGRTVLGNDRGWFMRLLLELLVVDSRVMNQFIFPAEDSREALPWQVHSDITQEDQLPTDFVSHILVSEKSIMYASTLGCSKH